MQLDVQNEELRIIMPTDSESGIEQQGWLVCVVQPSAGKMQMAGGDSKCWVLESPGDFFIACLGPELGCLKGWD